MCQNCPFGYYNDLPAQIDCKQCPLHHSTRRMKSKSLKNCYPECRPGTYARRKTIKIKTGKNATITRPTLMPYCRSCLLGYYQPDYNQFKCLPCPKGYTTNDRNSKSVSDCLPTIEMKCKNVSSQICNNGHCKLVNEFEYTCECDPGFIGELVQNIFHVTLY